ncbi:MAG: protein-export chaperone SecB [Alphaproteobacteria bacterium]|nr:protein-export chaperone SecB [Alphaproteobacteria bacterium]
MTAEADTPSTDDAAPGPTVPPITIGAQYIKDLSFEAPEAPGVFSKMQSEAPDIQINVDVRANHLQDNTYEVVLLHNAQCKVGDTTAFILELTYAGLFSINAPKENMRPLLLIEGPRLLFPFSRNIIADISRDGGFPPMMLSPLDFVEMYRRGMAEDAKVSDDGGDDSATESTPDGASTH